MRTHRGRKTCVHFASALLAVLAALPGPTFAQSDTGRIEGVVVDSQGGAIPGATVVARRIETNETFEAVADRDGNYAVAPLRAGTYALEVAATAFKRYERPDVVLQVNQVARIDVELAAGDINETVEITGGESTRGSLHVLAQRGRGSVRVLQPLQPPPVRDAGPVHDGPELRARAQRGEQHRAAGAVRPPLRLLIQSTGRERQPKRIDMRVSASRRTRSSSAPARVAHLTTRAGF